MTSKAKSPGTRGSGVKRGLATPAKRNDLLRNAIATLAAFLTVAAVARLFVFGAWAQLGLVAGASAGLIATSPAWALVAGVSAVIVGLTVTLGAFGSQAGLPALGAAVVAIAVRWIISRREGSAQWIAFAVIGLIVVNVWVTTLYVSFPHTAGVTPVAQEIARSPQLGVSWNDGDFYRRVLWRMRAGTGYYDSYRQAFNENPKWAMNPPSVISYRLPTAFWFWSSLPGGPLALIVAWLLVSTAAFAAGMWLAQRRVSVTFILPAAAALATYLIYFGTSSVVLFTEAWGAALGVIAVAAVVESFDSNAWRPWTLVGVAFALLACLVRELMVYLPVAGVIAAMIAGGPQRSSGSLRGALASLRSPSRILPTPWP